jgi:radical SAM superfamily enzyme YgiQ (UPF0313 family)
MKKLVLINPVNRLSRKIYKSLRFVLFPPLGLGYIAALTPKDWQIELIDENIDDFSFKKADLVGITSVTSTINRAYEIASIYRKENIPVIMGGIHVSMLPNEALRYVDSVVIGEAEPIWQKVLSDFESGNLRPIYKSSEFPSLDKLIRPKREIFDKKYKMGTIQTTRGCPMNCEFCSVTTFNGNKYRQRPIEDVLDELENIPQKIIYFIDDNLIGYGKAAEERTLKLFKGMIDRKINKLWGSQVSLNFTENEEILKYASKSGCVGVFMGLESINEDTLREMGKKINLKMGISKYKEVFNKLHKYGMIVLGSMIFGSDGDDESVFKETASFILDSGMDIPKFSVLTPLPGTTLFNRLIKEKRIIYNDYPKDWSFYDFGNLIFKPQKISSQKFVEGIKYISNMVNSPTNSIRRFVGTLFSAKNLLVPILAYIGSRELDKLPFNPDLSIQEKKQLKME